MASRPLLFELSSSGNILRDLLSNQGMCFLVMKLAWIPPGWQRDYRATYYLLMRHVLFDASPPFLAASIEGLMWWEDESEELNR